LNQMQQTYYCPACKAPVASGQDFCRNCGTVLTWTSRHQLFYCPYCSSAVTYGRAACSICGTKLIWAGQQMSQATASQSHGVQGNYGQGWQDFQQQAYWQQSGWNTGSQYNSGGQTSTQESGSGPWKPLIRTVSGLLFALIIGGGALLIGMNWNSITSYIQGGGSKSGAPLSSTEELVIRSFTASPATIAPGQKSTLSWDTGGATSVSIDHGIGEVAFAGSSSVSPPDSTTYTLTATSSTGSVARSTKVNILVSALPVISVFKAAPSVIDPGQTATLQWNVTGAESVTIDQEIGDVPPEGSLEVSPSENTTYTLTATGTSGSSTATVTVSLAATDKPLISSFTATPAQITAGQSSTLQWNVTGATSCTMDPDIGEVPPEGSLEVSPTENTTYTLTATGTSGSPTATVTVSVAATDTPLISSFTATPAQITAGQSSILQWNVTGATSCTIDPDIGEVPLEGSLEVAPPETTIYTLTAQGEPGTADSTVTVTVNPGG
jgi:hypothetical protein